MIHHWHKRLPLLVAVAGTSMLPALRHGDLVLVAPGEPEPEDIVVWMTPFGLAVHRVTVALDAAGHRHWRTQGDGNTAADRYAVRAEDVLGVVRLRVPYLGLPRLLATQTLRVLAKRIARLQLIACGSDRSPAGLRHWR